MKIALVALGVLVAAAALGGRAEAQNYPWCATYADDFGGSSNCGFATFQQCRAAISGMGGFCTPNNLYVPPAGSARARQRR